MSVLFEKGARGEFWTRSESSRPLRTSSKSRILPDEPMQTTDESLLWISEADNERREARRTKAAQTSQAGEPIELPSKPLDLIVRGNDAWIAENGFVARRLDLVVRSSCSRPEKYLC